MAPLPPNSTGVYFVDYATNGIQHTLQVRYSPTAGIDGAAGYAELFINALASVRHNDWSIIGARVRPAGSNITLPALPPSLEGAGTGTSLAPFYNPRFVSFIGRGVVDGRRVRVNVFGLAVPQDDDYRLTGPLGSPWSTAIAVLEAASAAGSFITIGGSDVEWYDYVNIGFNSYWERQARKG